MSASAPVSISTSRRRAPETGRRIGVALRARLDQGDGRGLITLFRGQHLYVAGGAALVLHLNQGEAVGRAAFGSGLRCQRVRVGLKRVQGFETFSNALMTVA